ncbi:MAG TPA: NAD(P)-binding protein [Syntrophorhabdaceae bacterium]|nr:NAD(P)-binding protein [Syntrophorhabdaceae bacterium]
MATLTIDNTTCSAREGSTIIDAARENGIDIPSLGYDPRVSPPTSIEISVVEMQENGRSRIVSATSTAIAEGMVINTISPALESFRRIYLQALLRNHYGDCVAPCVARCPAHIDIQKYLYHVANGNFVEALAVIKENNPFPSVCGRVCPHPCEQECRRNAVDSPVNINGVKRFVGDFDSYQTVEYTPPVSPDTGRRVAVVGAGPAGLTCAYFLRCLGHQVTIFEKQEAAGGMLRWGIPYYRLPEDTLDREIRAILSLNIDVRYNRELGKDFTIQSLKRDGYEAIFLGIGAQRSSRMAIPGEDLPGVMTGLDLLARIARNERPDLGDCVVVFGGGNTAMDAARSAIRLGTEKVIVAYRRTRAEMPAQDIEIEEAVEEGAQLMYLTAPVSIGRENGGLSLRCMRMELGEPDASGRRRPVPVEGSEFTIVCSTIITAIGQIVDNECIARDDVTTKHGTVLTGGATTETSIPGVFSGGDCVSGPDIAINAIGAGKRAALEIDEYLRTGKCTPLFEPYNCSKGHWSKIPPDEYKWVAPAQRLEVFTLAPETRKENFRESTRTWDEKIAMREAKRCLSCGCTERYACSLRRYASEYGVEFDQPTPARPLPIDDNHPFIVRDPGKCILCGLCLKICREMEGSSALSFYETDNVLTIGPNDHRPLDMTVSVACGHCATTCPTGALSFKPVSPDIYRALHDPNLTVVAQIAPAVRATFGQHYGIDATEVMAVLSAGLKDVGFDFVFDTCWAADLTIMEEGTEFLSRVAEGGVLPQITSCCPAWVNYCEKMAPDILPHLSSCKSPQQMFGSVMKQYFARQLKVPPEHLFFVSVMPCNAKKYEARRPEFNQGGFSDVDAVLTTTEVIKMFEERGMDPKTIKPVPVDAFFGKVSGAGVIFGASGGVAEAALRLAAERVIGKRMEGFTYEQVRGLNGVKETTIKLGDTVVRLAVVSGLQNAQDLIDRMRAGDAPYDLIEVMACPGGCINGSGNPTPKLTSDPEDRLEVLYRLDEISPIKRSQDNPTIQAIYTNWLGEPDGTLSHHNLHTTYRRRSMRVQETVEELLRDNAPIDVGVCLGTSCYLKGSFHLLEGLSAELRKRGLSERFRIKARFCTDQCAGGPNVVVGTNVINHVDPDNAPGFIDAHLIPALRSSAGEAGTE